MIPVLDYWARCSKTSASRIGSCSEDVLEVVAHIIPPENVRDCVTDDSRDLLVKRTLIRIS